MKPAEADKQPTESKKYWRMMYLLVIISLAVLIVLFYLFTKHFS